MHFRERIRSIFRTSDSSQSGQSLVEILVSVGIVAILISSVVAAIVLTLRVNEQSEKSSVGSTLSQGLLDEVRSITGGRWHDLYDLSIKGETSTYHTVGTTIISIASGTESVIREGVVYTSWFSVENVRRDSGGNIVTSGGIKDSSTQKITARTEWNFRGDIASAVIVEYLTRWTRNQVTHFSNWDGSAGYEGPITRPDSNYSTSTNINFEIAGEISL